MNHVKVAVLGAGLIGKRHVEHLMAEPMAELAAIVDPSPAGKEFALSKGAPWYPSFADMLGNEKPDALIIATPNNIHVANGLEAVAAGIPTLVEKPIADNIQSGIKLVEAAEKTGMNPGDPLPIDISRIAPSTFVGEVVMKQEFTPFLRAAKARGCQVGTDMLFEQIPAYLEFFGFPAATPEELRAVAKIEY